MYFACERCLINMIYFLTVQQALVLRKDMPLCDFVKVQKGNSQNTKIQLDQYFYSEKKTILLHCLLNPTNYSASCILT